MPARVTTRPLRDILLDVTLRDRPVTKALALEAARSVAADGLITKSEVDALEAFGDGPATAARERRARSEAWQEGTAAGRALFNSLAETVEGLYSSGNFQARSETPMNHFAAWWVGGWYASNLRHVNDKPVPVTAAALLKDTRSSGERWLSSEFDGLLKRYPKAATQDSGVRTPKPDVLAAYNAIKADWLKGKITNERDLLADLKPLLDARYR